MERYWHETVTFYGFRYAAISPITVFYELCFLHISYIVKFHTSNVDRCRSCGTDS